MSLIKVEITRAKKNKEIFVRFEIVLVKKLRFLLTKNIHSRLLFKS